MFPVMLVKTPKFHAARQTDCFLEPTTKAYPCYEYNLGFSAFTIFKGDPPTEPITAR
jgi:hypothetical protein